MQPTVLKHLSKYFYTNIIASFFFVTTLIGGLVFWAYFTQEKYLPVMDLMSSLTLIGFSALTATLGIVFLLFTIFMPGWIWRTYIHQSKSALVRKVKYIGHLCGNYNRVYAAFLFTPLAAWTLLMFAFGAYPNFESAFFKICFVLGVIIGIGNFLYLWLKLKLKPLRNWASYLVYYASSLGSSVLLFPAFFLVIKSPAEWTQESEWFSYFALVTFWMYLFFIINLISHRAKPNEKLKHWAGIVVFGFIILIFFTKTLQTLPSSVIKLYHLGNMSDVTLITKREACSFFEEDFKEYLEVEDGSCRIQNIRVVSKIGKEILIEANKKRFTIKSDMVHSYIDNTNPDEKESTAPQTECVTITN